MKVFFLLALLLVPNVTPAPTPTPTPVVTHVPSNYPLCAYAGKVVSCNVVQVLVNVPYGCTGEVYECFTKDVTIQNNGYCWANWATTPNNGYIVALGFVILSVTPTSPTSVHLTVFFPENGTTGGIDSKVNVICNP